MIPAYDYFYSMNIQRPSNIVGHPAILQLGAWIFFGLVFFLALSGVQPPFTSFKAVATLFVPAIPAVYLHLWLFDQWIPQKKYLQYLLVTLLIILAFSQCMNFLAHRIIFPEDDQLFIASELVLVFFIVVSTGLKYFFIGLASEKRLMEIEAKQHKAELDSLKMQVNPHFLFNSLNNIYGLIEMDKDQAGESLLTLSDLLRYLIDTSQKSYVNLEDEIKFVDDYLAMERLRIGEKCEISFGKSGDFTKCSLSPFLLIPFVENAFKHGSFATVGESFVHIEARIENQYLSFQVKNSVKEPKTTSREGVGIANVKRRLALLLPNRHELIIQRHVHSFEIKLNMELSC